MNKELIPDSFKKLVNFNLFLSCMSNQEKFLQNDEDDILFTYNLYSQNVKHEESIEELLYVDMLTKLPNRAKLIKDVQNDHLGIISLAIVDINAFKEINDFFGHKIADNILKGVSNLIIDLTEKYEDKVLFYKFPADTYCLANLELTNEEFENIIIDIDTTLDKRVFHEEEHEIDVSVTSGITFSTKNNKLITADIALQTAKKDHKSHLVFYDELDNFQEFKSNMEWTKKLKIALEKDNIIVYFQPLVNNQTMKVDKYECLVRMVVDDKIISPFFFLEVSKKANQYDKITKIVIEKSFKEFENLPFEFSVNVSYEDIEDPGFLDYIKEKLNTYNVASRVVWEILEDEGIKNYDVLLHFIDEVKALGCQVAIDDFGSGYSNFEHLLKMNIDYLKIDASLIKHVATDENSYQVVKTIMEFAKSLNLKTIAEFVENEEIFNITKELGATYSQGYYFAPPIAKPNLYNFHALAQPTCTV
ncbi:MAG: hypothetical protein DRG78_19805 [Epsilonproteobacteria bacterium]|nr:MAG: hypothetical protein DRG78_19805 [Campylobacterota bacterium]